MVLRMTSKQSVPSEDTWNAFLFDPETVQEALVVIARMSVGASL